MCLCIYYLPCIYVCMGVYICIMDVCKYLCLYVLKYVWSKYVCMDGWMYGWMHACMMYVRMDVCLDVCILSMITNHILSLLFPPVLSIHPSPSIHLFMTFLKIFLLFVVVVISKVLRCSSLCVTDILVRGFFTFWCFIRTSIVSSKRPSQKLFFAASKINWKQFVRRLVILPSTFPSSNSSHTPHPFTTPFSILFSSRTACPSIHRRQFWLMGGSRPPDFGMRKLWGLHEISYPTCIKHTVHFSKFWFFRNRKNCV